MRSRQPCTMLAAFLYSGMIQPRTHNPNHAPATLLRGI